MEVKVLNLDKKKNRLPVAGDIYQVIGLSGEVYGPYFCFSTDSFRTAMAIDFKDTHIFGVNLEDGTYHHWSKDSYFQLLQPQGGVLNLVKV